MSWLTLEKHVYKTNARIGRNGKRSLSSSVWKISIGIISTLSYLGISQGTIKSLDRYNRVPRATICVIIRWPASLRFSLSFAALPKSRAYCNGVLTWLLWWTEDWRFSTSRVIQLSRFVWSKENWWRQGRRSRGGWGGFSPPTFEEDDIFFVFVLVYGTYKEINKKTKVFSSGYSPKEGWNTWGASWRLAREIVQGMRLCSGVYASMNLIKQTSSETFCV